MSVTFQIKNTEDKIMSINELLACSKGKLSQFTIKENEENYEEILNEPLNQFRVIVFGELGVSGRGSEMSYNEEENSYDIRIYTPSTIPDWYIALCFIENIATFLNSNVVDEYGEVYAPNNVDYDFMNDINFGIKTIFSNIKEDFNNSVIFSILRPIMFNREMVKQLEDSENKAKEFSDIINYQLYHYEPYIANQFFFTEKDNDNIIGVYVLTQNVLTLLPYKYPPFIDITQYSLKQEDIHEWQICLMTHKGNGYNDEEYEEYTLPYQTFLERIPKDKCIFLDGHYMILELNKKELLRIVNNKKESFFTKIKNLFKK